jgi:nucleotide-binding universal stress UspA family protein
MIRRILLAIDDTPAALAAARVANDDRVPPSSGNSERAAASVLRYVAGMAQRAAVPVDEAQLVGEPAATILDEASTWSADLIVVGRAGSSGFGAPYIGGRTRHVLEFADVPVLVVPPPRH